VEQVFAARSALLRVAALKGPETQANALEDSKNLKNVDPQGLKAFV
jgi:hypothetical protein